MGAVGALVGARLLADVARGGSRDVGSMPADADPVAVARFQDQVTNVLAILRGLHWTLWTTHWQVHGESYYGDHLLFERLYTGPLTEQIDGLGERMVAYFGVPSVNSHGVLARTSRYVDAWNRISDPYKRALKGERELQSAIQVAYDEGKAGGVLSLGLDDFLMSLSNEHDTNIYLLQQRLQESQR